MKIKIKPFLKRLILENIYYIIGNIFIFILIVITINVSINANSNYNRKISSLELENVELMNKVTLMNSAIPKTDKLDEDVLFLNTLIPDTEDYFTIIYALEKLSQKSNFTITGYSVNVKGSTPEKIRISVSGTGDSQSLISFLKNYNFSGGRLITSDKVQLDTDYSGSIKIDLTFYNKKTKAASKLEMSASSNTYKELEELKSKVSFNFDNDIASNSGDLNYPTKLNPF